jgi:hypothetical protein
MSVSSVKTGVISPSSLLAGNLPFIPNDYESIASVTVGSGGQSSITFSSIPSTYQHLQIRGIAQVTFGSDPGGGGGVGLRFNSDTGANYTRHLIGGQGTSSLDVYGEANTSFALIERFLYRSTNNNVYGTAICDILDYSNTNKFKTIRNLGGWDANGTGEIYFNSSVWRSTSAISNIQIYLASESLKQYSSFALYGIKG